MSRVIINIPQIHSSAVTYKKTSNSLLADIHLPVSAEIATSTSTAINKDCSL